MGLGSGGLVHTVLGIRISGGEVEVEVGSGSMVCTYIGSGVGVGGMVFMGKIS